MNKIMKVFEKRRNYEVSNSRFFRVNWYGRGSNVKKRSGHCPFMWCRGTIGRRRLFFWKSNMTQVSTCGALGASLPRCSTVWKPTKSLRQKVATFSQDKVAIQSHQTSRRIQILAKMTRSKRYAKWSEHPALLTSPSSPKTMHSTTWITCASTGTRSVSTGSTISCRVCTRMPATIA